MDTISRPATANRHASARPSGVLEAIHVSNSKGYIIPPNGRPSLLHRIPPPVRAIAIVAVLYVFLLSIGLMGSGFKAMGKGFAETMIEATGNPFVGLFVGILATSVVQSSSLTTSMTVAMVAAGTLDVAVAVPIVMGANIGTTVTNTLISLGYVGRREEFRRAFACATVHDFFNYLCVVLLLPLELMTKQIFGAGLLQSTAGALAGALAGADDSIEFAGPVKLVTKPAVKLIHGSLQTLIPHTLTCCWVLVALAFVALVFALWAITKLMRSLVLSRMERVLDRAMGRNAALGVAVGLVLTAIVQSSSITTSLLVPLAAAGVVRLRQVFPITVGANIGTTVTALLAALGGNAAGLHVALVHLLFNTVGALIFLPFKTTRQLPIRLAQALARASSRSPRYALAYVLLLFFALPGLLVFLN